MYRELVSGHNVIDIEEAAGGGAAECRFLVRSKGRGASYAALLTCKAAVRQANPDGRRESRFDQVSN